MRKGLIRGELLHESLADGQLYLFEGLGTNSQDALTNLAITYGPEIQIAGIQAGFPRSLGFATMEAMPRVINPFQFVLIAVAGWMNQRQQQAIDYLREENRVLREQLGERRLRFSDDQRRRLAAKAQGLGRKLLAEIVTVVTPETLLAWHRKLGLICDGKAWVMDHIGLLRSSGESQTEGVCRNRTLGDGDQGKAFL